MEHLEEQELYCEDSKVLLLEIRVWTAHWMQQIEH